MEKEKLQKQIGQQLAMMRKSKGMTQEELARLCGLTQNHITRIENGCYNVGLYQVHLIARAMGYDIAFKKLTKTNEL